MFTTGGCVYPLAVFPYEFSKYCQSSKRNMGRGSEIFPPKLLRKCNRYRFRHEMFGLCVSFRYFLWLEVGGIVCTDVYVHAKRPLKNSPNFSKRILVLYWLGDYKKGLHWVHSVHIDAFLFAAHCLMIFLIIFQLRSIRLRRAIAFLGSCSSILPRN